MKENHSWEKIAKSVTSIYEHLLERDTLVKLIILVVGPARISVKIAPLYDELKKRSKSPILINIGQHYDEKMSKSFF